MKGSPQLSVRWFSCTNSNWNGNFRPEHWVIKESLDDISLPRTVTLTVALSPEPTSLTGIQVYIPAFFTVTLNIPELLVAIKALLNTNWNTSTVGFASEVQFRNKLPPANTTVSFRSGVILVPDGKSATQKEFVVLAVAYQDLIGERLYQKFHSYVVPLPRKKQFLTIGF